jgi:hypothetical protein
MLEVNMKHNSDAAMERTMKIQEVILRALAVDGSFPCRTLYRCGYRPGKINVFGLGSIELRLPRDRKEEFHSEWLPEKGGPCGGARGFLIRSFSGRVINAGSGSHYGEALGLEVRLPPGFAHRGYPSDEPMWATVVKMGR